ncbi:citramalate synthase [Scrofimicrobium sp. R131]|uniref:Citramalate synthase n=1 Tax=Scrofimicrobium appendicitidis TaxID=3079930 RepID=A0AAU7V8E2_9ACTO
MNQVTVYDTTLRDGAQMEGISLSLSDKLRILPILDELGVDIVEGGWPGAIPKDTEFFRQATQIPLRHARLAAFGSTCRAGVPAAEDPQVLALRDSGAPIITLVAKSDPRHVKEALRTSEEENLRMVADTVTFLTQSAEVMVDLEHYFDGLAFDPTYGVQVALAAAQAGASAVICCDTNGGNLPPTIARAVAQLRATLDEAGFEQVEVGIHAHNDTGCAVANTLAAIEAGATQFQGTVNGYGERTGNANLLTCLANLQLKLGYELVSAGALRTLTAVSYRVAEIVNMAAFARDPYVGQSAFAHKAGLHASAIRVNPDLYQHLDPDRVGNDMRMLVSEMAGRASIELKASELGIDLGEAKDLTAQVAHLVKAREAEGYTYDAADASFDLLLREALGEAPHFWRVESWKVTTREITNDDDVVFAESEATVKLRVGDRYISTAEGNGPVNALDQALRIALEDVYPHVAQFHLTNFKVRILDEDRGGTDAPIRVLIDQEDEQTGLRWTTVGVATNIIEASWQALLDSYRYGLMQAGAPALTS